MKFDLSSGSIDGLTYQQRQSKLIKKVFDLMEHTNMPLEKRFYPFKGGSIGNSRQIMKLGEIFTDYISIMQHKPSPPDRSPINNNHMPQIPYEKAFVKEPLYKFSSCNNAGTNT